MKWCVLGKTMSFHAFSTKKENKTMSLLGGTVSPSSSPEHATGEEKFLFFLPLYPSPRALLKPKPDATRTSS
jgi:hypothetical protein